MIADQKSKKAVIVDPQRDVDQYVQDAKSQGLTISDVLLTHFHADFVAGHLELQERTGATIHLGSQAKPEYDFQPRREGDSMVFGDTKLQFLETPGHTPEAMSIVAYDLAKDPNKPLAVLTGDTLFAGDVGRPDLAVANGVASEYLAGQLYESLHQKLLKLPDETTVYPAHGPGSSCGTGGGLKGKVTTIGQERTHNPMLQIAHKQAFVDKLTHHLPAPPAYFSHDVQLNKIERPTLEETLLVQQRPLGLDEIASLVAQGATVLDVRHPDDFSAGHYQGSLNVGLDGRFAEWAGSIVDLNKPVVVVAPDGREHEALVRLNRVGFEMVAGYMQGGISQVANHPELQESQTRVSPEQLSQLLADSNPPVVIDVRTPTEFAKGHLEGARNIPLSELAARADEVPDQGPVAIHCQSGYRSSIAASLVGPREGLVELKGGFVAWAEAGLPVTK